MINCIYLPNLIKQVGTNLSNIRICGYPEKLVNRPSVLQDTACVIDNTVFVQFRCIFIDLSNYTSHVRSMMINSNIQNFMLNGSIIVAMHKDKVSMGTLTTLSGSLYQPRKTDDYRNYLMMVRFSKNSKGNFDISGVASKLYSITDFSIDIKDDVFKVLSKYKESRVLDLPLEVKSLQALSLDITNTADSALSSYGCENNASRDSNPIMNNAMGTSTVSQQLPSYIDKAKAVATLSNSDLPFIREDRFEPLDLSDCKSIDYLQNIIDDASSKTEDFVADILTPFVTDTDFNKSQLGTLLSNLSSNWTRKPSQFVKTGRALVKNYINEVSDLAGESFNGAPFGDTLLSLFKPSFLPILSKFYDQGEVDEIEFLDYIPLDDVWLKDAKLTFLDPEKFYAGIFGQISGLGMTTALKIQSALSANSYSFISVVHKNPYVLGIMLDGVSFSTCETIGYSLGVAFNKDLEKARNICLLDDYCTDKSVSSTMFMLDTLSGAVGSTITGMQYNLLQRGRTILSGGTGDSMQAYLGLDSLKVCENIPKRGWIKNYSKYILPLTPTELKVALEDYIASGLGVVYDLEGTTYLSSSKYLTADITIVKTLLKRCTETKYTDEDKIKELICKFEDLKGFKLEEQQRKGVFLVKWNVFAISGPAGSGKTTLSECILYVMENYDSFAPDVRFAAPTGKASKKLQEVIGRKVGTINRELGIGIGGDSISFSSDTSGYLDAVNSADFYFFDETGMVTTDTMLQVVNRTDRIGSMFLGDIDQLPPIGKGLPFRLILRFLPCVILDVCKRCEEGSCIGYNNKIVNHNSSQLNWKPLKTGKDFGLLSCDTPEIPKYVSLVTKYFLGTLTSAERSLMLNVMDTNSEILDIPECLSSDDIQICSPISSAKYLWGTYHLNKLLQNIFNPSTGETDYVRYNLTSDTFKDIRVGDRVIHSNKNCYNMQWYSSYENDRFQLVPSAGISNGEMGKVVSIVDCDDARFYKIPKGTPIPDDYDSKRVRNDSKLQYGKFVVVEYFDYMSDINFYILYHCESDLNSDGKIPVVKSEDLKNLDLAYALNTHKLQGSQAKVLIFACGYFGKSDFISRNMIYTAVSRGQKVDVAIGSVVGNNSQLAYGRSKNITSKIKTPAELVLSKYRVS